MVPDIPSVLRARQHDAVSLKLYPGFISKQFSSPHTRSSSHSSSPSQWPCPTEHGPSSAQHASSYTHFSSSGRRQIPVSTQACSSQEADSLHRIFAHELEWQRLSTHRKGLLFLYFPRCAGSLLSCYFIKWKCRQALKTWWIELHWFPTSDCIFHFCLHLLSKYSKKVNAPFV